MLCDSINLRFATLVLVVGKSRVHKIRRIPLFGLQALVIAFLGVDRPLVDLDENPWTLGIQRLPRGMDDVGRDVDDT